MDSTMEQHKNKNKTTRCKYWAFAQNGDSTQSKVSQDAKIRNRYNQYHTQDHNKTTYNNEKTHFDEMSQQRQKSQSTSKQRYSKGH